MVVPFERQERKPPRLRNPRRESRRRNCGGTQERGPSKLRTVGTHNALFRLFRLARVVSCNA